MLLIVAAFSMSGGVKASASDRDTDRSQLVKGENIAALLEGKLITPSMRYRKNALPTGEWFGIDHQWHASLRSFELQQIAGTWDVEGDSVCVMRADKPKFCRAIWRNSKSGEISMAMVPDWSTTANPIVVNMVERTWGLAK